MDVMKQLNLMVIVITTLAFAWILGGQIASIRTADRVVTVRGAAEIPAVADLATWALGVTATGNDLAEVQRQLDGNIKKIKVFLKKYDVKDEEIENANVTVSDALANQYNNNLNGMRYSVSSGVNVRTANLEGVAKAKNNLSDLLAEGVVLSNSYGPNYAFTKLNEAKLDLISQATAAARQSAAQFAKDSGTKLGGIRRARQGSVEILGRDGFMGEAEQVNKILRVVTTVDYDIR